MRSGRSGRRSADVGRRIGILRCAQDDCEERTPRERPTLDTKGSGTRKGNDNGNNKSNGGGNGDYYGNGDYDSKATTKATAKATAAATAMAKTKREASLRFGGGCYCLGLRAEAQFSTTVNASAARCSTGSGTRKRFKSGVAAAPPLPRTRGSLTRGCGTPA